MKGLYIFLLLLISIIFLGLLSKYLLNVDTLLVESLSDRFTREQVENILNFQQKWEWIGYVFLPILLLLKIAIIAAIIDVGCFFFDKEIKYKKLFNIVVKAEFVFLLVIVCKTLWFYIFQPNYTLEDLQYFYPFSVLGIIGYKGLDVWWVYPFQLVNLFELAYWVILAYLLGKTLKIKTEKGFSIVASSYGIGLFIWVISVMFFTLNMS